MNLLMISGDRSVASGKEGPFLALLEEFHTHFNRIDIICPRVKTKGPFVYQIFGNVFIHPSPSSLLWQPIFIFRKALKLHKESPFDIMTIHEFPPFYNGIGARLLLRKFRIPSLLEIHHIVGYPIAGSVTEFIGRILSRFFLPSHVRSFSAVRIVSRATQNTLQEWGVPDATLSLIPSVYLDHGIAARMKGLTKKWDVVFCGRLVANKGLLEVIDAMAKVPNTTLLVIGDGPERKRAEERVGKLGIQSRVTFTGWLPSNDDVARAIASSRLLVMNSKSEGGPRVVLEALSYGVPVVITKVGIMPECIQDGFNGYFTDGTSTDVSAKISRILAAPLLLDSMSKNALQILDRFEKKKVITEYANFLKSLVNSKSS